MPIPSDLSLKRPLKTFEVKLADRQTRFRLTQFVEAVDRDAAKRLALYNAKDQFSDWAVVRAVECVNTFKIKV